MPNYVSAVFMTSPTIFSPVKISCLRFSDRKILKTVAMTMLQLDLRKEDSSYMQVWFLKICLSGRECCYLKHACQKIIKMVDNRILKANIVLSPPDVNDEFFPGCYWRKFCHWSSFDFLDKEFVFSLELLVETK